MSSKLSLGVDVGFHDVWRYAHFLYSIVRRRWPRHIWKNSYTSKAMLLLLFLVSAIQLRFARSKQIHNTPPKDTLHLAKDTPLLSFHRHEYPNPPRPQRKMLQSPIYLDDASRSKNEDIVDVARNMGGVARFIKAEFCTGLQAECMPIRNFLNELVERLLNYGWPLVSPNSLHKLDLPGDKAILANHEAVQAMEYLANVFEQRAEAWGEFDREFSKNDKLSKDLKFAARHTQALLDSLAVDEVRGAVDDSSANGTAQRDKQAAQPRIGEAGPPSYNAHGGQSLRASLEEVVDKSYLSTGQSEIVQGYAYPRSEAEPQPVSHSIASQRPYRVESLKWQSQQQTDDENDASSASSLVIDARDEPVERTGSSQTDPCTSEEASAKVDHNVDIPHELRRPRLTGRSQFENDAEFSELIGQIRQWRESNPEFDFTTIAGGNDDDFDDLLQHFCDAEPLGISALFSIKCEHPLDPDVVKHLDLDVLRFVRLALWDCTNGHPERVAERESFEILRREIRARKGELAEILRRAAACQPSDQPADRHSQHASAPKIRVQEGLASEEAMLQPDWLSPDYETPEADESTVRVVKAQTMIPVGMPTECTIRGSKAKVVQDTEEFTTLQRRTRLAALGVETTLKGSRPAVSSNFTSLRDTEELAFLQGVIDSLRKQFAELEDEAENLRPLDSPPKGSRSDDTHAHPLQHLVGSQERPTTPSLEALLDSESDDHLEADEDSKRHTRNEGMSLTEFLKKCETPPSPTRPRETSSQRTSPNRWLQPFNMMKAKKPTISDPIPHNKSKPLICEGEPSNYQPLRGSKARPQVYEGNHLEPKTYVPKQALKSSRGRERVDRAARETSADKDPLNSEPVFGQPGNRSMREV